MRFGTRLAVALAVSTLGAACGIPEDDEPRALSEDVPFGLLDPAPTSSTSTTLRNTQTVQVKAYLVGESTLAAVTREVAIPGTIETVLGSLLEGPSEDEQERNITTAIPAGTRLLRARLDSDTRVLTIDLSQSGLFELGGEEQRTAFAQLVYTATGDPSIEAVLFERQGEPRGIPVDEGGAVNRPVRRRDYASFDPDAEVAQT